MKSYTFAMLSQQIFSSSVAAIIPEVRTMSCRKNGLLRRELASDFDVLSPYPENVEIAYEAVLSMKRLEDGIYDPNDERRQLDHETLHPFIRRTGDDGEMSASLGAVFGAQNAVLKDLVIRTERLEEVLGM
jgi:hypothetical protein